MTATEYCLDTSAAASLAPLPDRIPELDGLRGIAVLMVIAWHYVDAFASPWLTPLRLGWSGVDLFFVLSGFLIGGILLDHRGSRCYFRAFYGRRICRIFPLYYLWIAFVLFSHKPADAPHWSYPLFLQNLFIGTHASWDSTWIGHTWSLAIEEQFYLLAPLAIRFLPARLLPWAGAAVLAGAPLYRCLLPARWPLAANMMTPGRADTLVMGMLAAGLIRQPRVLSWLRSHTRWLAAAAVCFSLVLIDLLLRFQSVQTLHPLWYSVLAATFSTLLLYAVVSRESHFASLLRTPWLRRAGALSFALYILHLPCYTAMQSLTGSRLAASLVGGGMALALARLSADYFEGPLLRFGRARFHYR